MLPKIPIVHLTALDYHHIVDAVDFKRGQKLYIPIDIAYELQPEIKEDPSIEYYTSICKDYWNSIYKNIVSTRGHVNSTGYLMFASFFYEKVQELSKDKIEGDIVDFDCCASYANYQISSFPLSLREKIHEGIQKKLSRFISKAGMIIEANQELTEVQKREKNKSLTDLEKHWEAAIEQISNSENLGAAFPPGMSVFTDKVLLNLKIKDNLCIEYNPFVCYTVIFDYTHVVEESEREFAIFAPKSDNEITITKLKESQIPIYEPLENYLPLSLIRTQINDKTRYYFNSETTTEFPPNKPWIELPFFVGEEDGIC